MNALNKRRTQKVTFTNTEGYYNIGEDAIKLTEDCHMQQAREALFSEKLSELGYGCRRLLQLSWSGKPMEEVAGILKVTYGYARKKKSECMAKLISLVRQSPQFSSLKL